MKFLVVLTILVLPLSHSNALEMNCAKFNEITKNQIDTLSKEMNGCIKELKKISMVEIQQPPVSTPKIYGESISDAILNYGSKSLSPVNEMLDGEDPGFRLFHDADGKVYFLNRTSPRFESKYKCAEVQCWKLHEQPVYFLRDVCYSHNTISKSSTSCDFCRNAVKRRCSTSRLIAVEQFKTRWSCDRVKDFYHGKFMSIAKFLFRLHLNGFYKNENETKIKKIIEKCENVAKISDQLSPYSQETYTVSSPSANKQHDFSKLEKSPLFTNLSAVLTKQKLAPVPTEPTLDAIMNGVKAAK